MKRFYKFLVKENNEYVEKFPLNPDFDSDFIEEVAYGVMEESNSDECIVMDPAIDEVICEVYL